MPQETSYEPVATDVIAGAAHAAGAHGARGQMAAERGPELASRCQALTGDGRQTPGGIGSKTALPPSGGRLAHWLPSEGDPHQTAGGEQGHGGTQGIDQIRGLPSVPGVVCVRHVACLWALTLPDRCNTWARSVYGRWAEIGVRPTYAPVSASRLRQVAAFFLKSLDFWTTWLSGWELKVSNSGAGLGRQPGSCCGHPIWPGPFSYGCARFRPPTLAPAQYLRTDDPSKPCATRPLPVGSDGVASQCGWHPVRSIARGAGRLGLPPHKL